MTILCAMGPGEGMHGCFTVGGYAVALQNLAYRQPKDPQIERNTAVIDIPGIERELGVPGQRVPAVDLRPSR